MGSSDTTFQNTEGVQTEEEYTPSKDPAKIESSAQKYLGLSVFQALVTVGLFICVVFSAVQSTGTPATLNTSLILLMCLVQAIMHGRVYYFGKQIPLDHGFCKTIVRSVRVGYLLALLGFLLCIVVPVISFVIGTSNGKEGVLYVILPLCLLALIGNILTIVATWKIAPHLGLKIVVQKGRFARMFELQAQNAALQQQILSQLQQQQQQQQQQQPTAPPQQQLQGDNQQQYNNNGFEATIPPIMGSPNIQNNDDVPPPYSEIYPQQSFVHIDKRK